MGNKITYRVKVIRTELEESDETKWDSTIKNQGKEDGAYYKTGHKNWKEKEIKEVFSQEFDEIDVSVLATFLNK